MSHRCVALFITVGVLTAYGCAKAPSTVQSEPEGEPQAKASSVFRRARVWPHPTPGTESIEAARELVAMPEGEAWAIIILLGDYPLRGPQGNWLSLEYIESFDYKCKVEVAVILDSMPEDVSGPLLWAVTTRLSDHESAHWGTFKNGEHAALSLGPIRELAREALRRALKTDHGYVAEAWQEEILKRGW